MRKLILIFIFLCTPVFAEAPTEQFLLFRRPNLNLIISSNNLTGDYWTSYLTSATANSGIAPNGLNQAMLGKLSTVSQQYRLGLTTQPISFAVGQPYNVSVYANYNGSGAGLRYICLTLFMGAYKGQCFDLQAASTDAMPISPSSGVAATGAINVGNGWYRLWMAMYVTASITKAACGFWPAPVAPPSLGWTMPGATANNTDGILLWGAQITSGLNLQPYQVQP